MRSSALASTTFGRLRERSAEALPIIERLLQEADNLKRAGDDFAKEGRGLLSVAATHSQARYALPPAVKDFLQAHPGVTLNLHQGSPEQVARMLLGGEADIGIATESLANYPDLLALPCYAWTHVVVVPHGHPLLALHTPQQPVSLQTLVRFPLITYEAGYTGRNHIDEAFRRAEVQPNVVLSAMDADVIKTYVELEMGVGILADMAFDSQRDKGLVQLDGSRLFAPHTAWIGLKQGQFQHNFAWQFIQLCNPELALAEIQARAMSNEPLLDYQI